MKIRSAKNLQTLWYVVKRRAVELYLNSNRTLKQVARKLGISVSKGNNIDAVLDKFRKLKIWQAGGIRAPHKPLLVLLAIRQCLRGGERLSTFTSWKEELNPLLTKFGPLRKTLHPEQPFWRLQNDGVWEIDQPDLVDETSKGCPTPGSLMRQNIRGGFTQPIHELFRQNPEVAIRVARMLLDLHFPATLHEEILRLTGIASALPGVLHAAEKEGSLATEVDTNGHDGKGDYDSSNSLTERKVAEGTESEPFGDTPKEQHTPTQPESTPANDTEESPEEDTNGHDGINDGNGSDGPKGQEEDEEPVPPPPREIGGKRNSPTRITQTDRAAFKSRPELICQQSSDSLRWDVILSVDFPIEAVKQNDQPLNFENGKWLLTSFTDQLTVHLKKGSPIHVSLFDKDPLIFKLNKNWNGDGRRVPRLTKGYFIVIAPKDWTLCGPKPIVEPHGCSDPAFMAHYFFRDGSESTVETGGFVEYEIASSAPGFKLRGKRVFDDSEEGDLFVDSPPELIPSTCVVWARVGEEATNGWKGENFNPNKKTLTEVLDGRQGRFFVRVYDGETKPKLIDSGEFRYLQALKEILVNGEPYSKDTLLLPLPQATGHPPTKVRFIGDIHPIIPSEAGAKVTEKGGLIAKSHPDADKISCGLEGDGGRVEIALTLPRVWWRIKGNDSEWRSKPFQMTRREFREYADSSTILLLRLPKRIKSVDVGFDDELDRNYRKTDDEIALRLDDFGDYTQIDRRLIEDTSFNVKINQDKLPLINISADPPPTITSFVADPPAIDPGERTRLRWETQNAEDVSLDIEPEIGSVEQKGSCEVTPSETTTYTLKIRVSGKKAETETLEVPVRTRLGPGEEFFKTTISLDLNKQNRSAQELIEDVKATLNDMDAKVVKTVDLGFYHDLPTVPVRKFKLTLKAPTSFVDKVRKMPCLKKLVNDPEHKLVILERKKGNNFGLENALHRIDIQVVNQLDF